MSVNAQRSGMSILPFLGLLFIGLKLCDKIDWSWWWVLAPFWIPFSLFILIDLGLAYRQFR